MKFRTISGSIYEIDKVSKRIRRLYGTEAATARQGKDGDWKSFEHIGLKVGASAIILWNPTTTPLLEESSIAALPATVTSQVVKIIKDIDNDYN